MNSAQGSETVTPDEELEPPALDEDVVAESAAVLDDEDDDVPLAMVVDDMLSPLEEVEELSLVVPEELHKSPVTVASEDVTVVPPDESVPAGQPSAR